MKKHAKFLAKAVTAGVLYTIIDMLWKMAEVKLYGFSYVSMVDRVGAWIIAVGIATVLLGGDEQ